MKVLLIWPNSPNDVLGWGDLGAIAEPLALEYLAAGAALDGHEVQILDMRLHSQDLSVALSSFEPDVVGVTAFSMHVLSALGVSRKVKEILPNSKVVAGGHHATLLPEDFFEPTVDFVICGEGVRPFCALLAALDAGRVPNIPGVWRLTEGEWKYGGTPPPFDIDDILLPDRRITSQDRASYFIDWMKPVGLVRTTVGCPYRCTFCSLWQIMGGRYHLRSVQSVVEEVRTIQEDFVFLVDDEAFIHGRRMQELGSALADASLKKRYFAYCRIDTLVRQREALRIWRAIGLERLFVGIDAVSQRNLDAYNKRVKVAQIEAGLRTAEELGIEVFAQFVVPLDAVERDFQELVRFIDHHRIRYPSFTVLTPLPGTSLLATFEDITERQENGRPNWDMFDCQNAVMRTALPEEVFRREYRNLYRVFKGAYTQYREHSRLLDRDFHDGVKTPIEAWARP